jgi:hypothetical protein
MWLEPDVYGRQIYWTVVDDQDRYEVYQAGELKFTLDLPLGTPPVRAYDIVASMWTEV